MLSLKELKLQAFSAPAGGAGSEEPEEENVATMTKAVLQVVQKKVVSQVGAVPIRTLQRSAATYIPAVQRLKASLRCSCPQVQKKAFIENTVPLIISLKNLLELKRSPVLKDLMAYLKVRVFFCHSSKEEFQAKLHKKDLSAVLSISCVPRSPSGDDAGLP